jgi:hypothetical protein
MRRLNGPHLGRAERSQLRERLYSIEVIFSTAHLVYSILYSVNSAVERYTAPSHPTTPLQSYTAYTALYSIYSVLYIIQLYSLYIIQLYTITLWP